MLTSTHTHMLRQAKAYADNDEKWHRLAEQDNNKKKCVNARALVSTEVNKAYTEREREKERDTNTQWCMDELNAKHNHWTSFCVVC